METEAKGAFWSDDFDMDLFKALPDAREWIAPIAETPLYTYGGLFNGRLNHPCVWNHNEGMISFWGTKPTGFKPEFYSIGSGREVIATNGEDAFRDIWVHGMLMVLDGERIVDTERMRPYFDAMMYRMRGWNEGRIPQDQCEKVCRVIITAAVARIQTVLARQEPYPHAFSGL